MATLVVRRLDDSLVKRLKERAVAHGRSAEAEHRAILEAALTPKMSGAEFWERLRPAEPCDLELEDMDQPVRVPDLS
jgi:antitoxin FitA